MKRKFLFTILFVRLHICESNKLLLQKVDQIEKFDRKKFIELPYDHECLQIVLDEKQQPPLIPLIVAFTTVYVRSHKSLKFRDIRTEKEGQCETFLIFAKNMGMVNEMFQFDHSFIKQFFPFTIIYCHLENRQNFSNNAEPTFSVQKFLTNNALFGYAFEYSENDNESNVVLRDLTTNDVMRKRESHIPKELLHPMVDTNLVKDNFRIRSLFNCTPYTIYPQQENEDATFINDMDGIEFRFVREVTNNWKKTFRFRDFSRVKISPYAVVLEDLTNKSSDMSMCSLWIDNDRYAHHDMSTFFDRKCVLFLVPKPRKLPEATAIYTTLDAYVWLLFLFTFLLSIVLLYNIAKTEKYLNASNSIFTDLTITVLETVNVATSHSVSHFPGDQISVKFVLISWILVCSFLGMSYTTIYSSRLASPSYEKPINTAKDMVDNGLSICSAFLDEFLLQQMSESADPAYREMARRQLVYKDNAQYRRHIFSARKCAVFESRLSTNYITSQKFEDDIELLSIFRPMKFCRYTPYFGFAFPKYSPYTKLFNWHIRRCQESGIILKWKSEILRYSKEMKTLFDDYPELDMSQYRIALIDVSGAFFLLLVGLLLAPIAFLMELLKYRNFLLPEDHYDEDGGNGHDGNDSLI